MFRVLRKYSDSKKKHLGLLLKAGPPPARRRGLAQCRGVSTYAPNLIHPQHRAIKFGRMRNRLLNRGDTADAGTPQPGMRGAWRRTRSSRTPASDRRTRTPRRPWCPCARDEVQCGCSQHGQSTRFGASSGGTEPGPGPSCVLSLACRRPKMAALLLTTSGLCRAWTEPKTPRTAFVSLKAMSRYQCIVRS